jgi:cytochrome c biogenesis factor
LELSKKPLIKVFWFGTFTAFLGGVLSMYERRRRRSAVAADAAEADSTPSAQLQPVAHDAA